MHRITSLTAIEILDSRGRPTIEVRCGLERGIVARAQVPSGASTGRAEAVELRDGDPGRYRGLGCLNAVSHVEGPIAEALVGGAFEQSTLDQALVALDGTPNKARLGANALLGVSLAFARACAEAMREPLYEYFASLIGGRPRTLPRLTINLFSGGKHAGGQVPLQDVLVVPAAADSVAAGLEQVVATYDAAADLIAEQYGARRLTADEGGLAPPFASVGEMFDAAVASIEAAGLEPGRDMALAVDVAASHFFDGSHYHFGPEPLDSRKHGVELPPPVPGLKIIKPGGSLPPVQGGQYEEDPVLQGIVKLVRVFGQVRRLGSLQVFWPAASGFDDIE